MISRHQLTGILLVAALLSPASSWGASPDVVEGEYIVRLKPSGVAKIQRKLQGKAFLKGAFPAKNTFHLTNTDPALIQELQKDPEVLYVEPNYRLNSVEPVEKGELVAASAVGTYDQTFAPIRAEEAWGLSSPYDAQNRPIVAVIDTGLDKNHSVFKDSGALWINSGEIPGNGIDDDLNGYVDDVNGWNFISRSANFYDDQGHGTHVSGIVLGATQDTWRRADDPAKIQIMPLKFLDSRGSGSTSAAVNAIYYAVDMGAKVINCSWGGSSYSRALHDALTFAYDRGVLVVTAAGNYSNNNNVTPMYPANYAVPSNLSVAATSDGDYLASFSNYGSRTVHLGAPGVEVWSTMPGGWWTTMSGTSMAAPLVAGAAALALREAPDLTGYQLRSLIVGSVDQVSGLSGDVISNGRINMEKMMQAARGSISISSYQPDYNPLYLAERDPAGETTAGGGCGMIQSVGAGSALLGSGGGGSLPPGAGAVAFLLLFSPVLFWLTLRQRAPESRRRHDRYVLNSDLVIKAGDRELVASLKTISMGGLSFDVDEALDKGGTIQMKVLGPDGKTAIDVEGHIVWNERNHSYGVQFDSVREQAKSTLFGWTKQLLKA